MATVTQSQLTSLSSGITSVLGGIATQVTEQVLGEALPLVGNTLENAAQLGSAALTKTQSLATVLSDKLTTLAAAGAQTTEIVQQELDAALNAAGIVGGAVVVNVVNGTEVVLQVARTATGMVIQDLKEDLAMPGLELVTDAVGTLNTATQFALEMGVDAAGFYLSSTGNDQIVLDLDLTDLAFNDTITFAGQDYTPTDGGSSLNATITVDLIDANNDGRIRTTEVGNDMVDAHIDGDARLDLGVTSANGQDGAAPVGADLVVDWHFSHATVNPNDNNTNFGNRPTVSFDNLTMDLGKFMENFIGPVLDKVNAVLDPIRPILDVLNSSIDLLENFPGGIGLFDQTNDGRVTLLDLLSMAGQASGHPVDLTGITHFIEMADKIADWTNFLSTQLFAGGDLNLGNFDLGAGQDIRSLSFDLANAGLSFSGLMDSLSGVIATLSGTGWNATDLGSGMTGAEILEEIVNGGDFDLPILTMPSEVMDLLLGKDVDLLTVDLPLIQLGAGGTLFNLPIFPLVNIKATGSVDITLDLDFGYSTRGLFTPGLTPLDGFFIVDATGPEVVLQSSIGIGAEGSILIATLTGEGNIEGTFNFELADLGNTLGRLYLDEFFAALMDDPFSIFEVSGIITAGFSAYAEVLGKEVWRWDSPRVVLGEFGFGDAQIDSLNLAEIQVATQVGTTLTINMGTRVGDLFPNAPFNLADQGEDVLIGVPPQLGDVQVNFDGLIDSFNDVLMIVADAGDNPDSVLMDATLNIKADFSGGTGADTLGGASLADTLDGNGGRDLLFGNGGADALNGGSGNDVLIGGAGADSLYGGLDQDTASYVGSGAGVTVNLGAVWQVGGHADGDRLVSIENIEGSAHGDSLTGAGVAGVLTGGEGNDTIRSGNGAQILGGGAGNDSLFAKNGGDTLVGGEGDDYYSVTSANDVVDEDLFNEIGVGSNSGMDTVVSAVDFDLSQAGHTQIEYLTLTAGARTATGNGLDNRIYGQNAQNVIFALEGNDTVRAYGENDSVYGAEGDDLLYGGEGNDMLDGGPGQDTFYGGNGNDNLWVATGDVVYHETNDGDDTIHARSDFVLGSYGVSTSLLVNYGADVLMAADGTDAIDLTGNARSQRIVGNDGDNILAGLGGADTLEGGAGSDTADYSTSVVGIVIDYDLATQSGGEAQGDTLDSIENIIGTGQADSVEAYGLLIGPSVDNHFEGRAGDDTLKGFKGNDTLDGDAGNDSLVGGADNDQLTGGDNDDTLQGQDGDDTLTGDAGTDLLEGGDGNDVLIGGAGSDTLDGGAGADAYTVTTGDVIIEGLAMGVDTVTANEDYTLATGVAVEVLLAALPQGNEAFLNLTLIGNEFNQTITGNAGDNVLQGRGGADTLNGGAGNDTVSYIGSAVGVDVDLNAQSQRYGDAQGDELNGLENIRGSNFDDVLTGLYTGTIISYDDNTHWGEGGNDSILDTYGQNTLYGGTGEDTLTGGNAASLLSGGDGNDDLRAGVTNTIGGDTLIGGLGDDIYRVSDILDVVDENGLGEIGLGISGGIDTVVSNVLLWSLALGNQADIENLTMGTGSNGTGNALANLITGNTLGNILIGNAGNDTINGASGNDLLYGGDDQDSLNGGVGNDTVYGGNGHDSVNGQDGDDSLIGNLGNDVLSAGIGDDSLAGGGGNDVLTGGLGADQFQFATSGGSDRITDYTDGTDHILLTGLAANFAELSVVQLGANAVITAGGVTITLTGISTASIDASDFLFA